MEQKVATAVRTVVGSVVLVPILPEVVEEQAVMAATERAAETQATAVARGQQSAMVLPPPL
jgi:hypothetical protein